MNRREFTGLVAAGAIFPADFVKGLAARASDLVPGLLPLTPSGPRIFCCGSEYNPATTEQISQLSDFLDRKKPTGVLARDDLTFVIGYSRVIGAPLNAVYELDFPLDRLVVGLGSDDRPAQEEDLIDVRNQLLELADDWEGSSVVTHHNFYPYEFQKCTLHDPPMVVLDGQWTEGALRRGLIRSVPMRWPCGYVTESEIRNKKLRYKRLTRRVGTSCYTVGPT